jgi:glycosyltransferase involved in cell wall biosynthesis
MHIAIDARYLDGTFSGIGTYSKCLLEALAVADQKGRYSVVVREGFDQPLALGPNFTLLSEDSAPISARTLVGLGRTLERLHPDAVHSLHPLAPLDCRVPQLVTVHDFQPFLDPEFSAGRIKPLEWAYQGFYRWAYPACLRRAQWILCVSQTTRDDIAALLPSLIPKLIVVRSGISPEHFDPPEASVIDHVRRQHSLRKPYGVYYGSTRPNKNLVALVEAFARFRKECPRESADLQIVLIVKRDRFFRAVEKAIRALRLEQDVRVMPQVSEGEKRAIVAGARALLFPTKYEGFGFPVLEAMAMGVPVLASTSGALPEVCGDAALLVDPFRVESIAEGMTAVLTERRTRERLKAAGPLRARQFRWSDTAEIVRDIYHLLLVPRTRVAVAAAPLPANVAAPAAGTGMISAPQGDIRH